MSGLGIDIKSLQNRLLKVCYVPATSATLNRLLFFSFLLRPLRVLMKQTRQAICAINSLYYFDVHGIGSGLGCNHQWNINQLPSRLHGSMQHNFFQGQLDGTFSIVLTVPGKHMCPIKRKFTKVLIEILSSFILPLTLANQPFISLLTNERLSNAVHLKLSFQTTNK